VTTQDPNATSAATAPSEGHGYAAFPITTTFEFSEYVIQQTHGTAVVVGPRR
jgi:hypothetical protein